MLNRRTGKVTGIVAESHGVQEVSIEIGGQGFRAVNYPALSGVVSVGDQVVVNTTAVDLGLGTGGVHFVISNLSRTDEDVSHEPGHIMKLRYTPMQTAVLSVEEDASPDRQAVTEFGTLGHVPVICCELHSQIAPAAAAVKALAGPETRIAYVMTDGAALPLSFSKLVAELRAKRILDATMTCGQAFGGDIEAVNVYTALISAKQVANADVVIVSQGPGNAGTGTQYGFSGIQQGEALNAVNILGSVPIMALRMSFADPRERHRGVSHHSLTVLRNICLMPVLVAIPDLQSEALQMVKDQLAPIIFERSHHSHIMNGEEGLLELERRGIRVKTMGRSVDEDREFFLAASAAGALAAKLLPQPAHGRRKHRSGAEHKGSSTKSDGGSGPSGLAV